MIDLGTVGGDPCSQAYGINAKAQVVGGSSSCTTFLHAFLWENGGPAIDLNTLVAPGAGLTMTVAGYINDRGEIAGAGFPTGCTAEDGDLCSHAYVLIPCDENHQDIEDCDFSEVEASARAITVGSRPVAQNPTTANPWVSAAPSSMLRSLGHRSMPWYRSLGVQRQPK